MKRMKKLMGRETGDTHTYEVYQIFTATSYDSTSGQFSGIKYGANSTGTLGSDVSTTVLNALSAVNSSSDADKIAVIDNYWNQTKAAFATINNTTATASLPTGYYLIKDTTTSTDGDSINFHVVTVSDGSTALTITDKRDVPTVQKYIKEDSTNTYGKAADYSKGEETIGFRLVGTLPAAADYARYTKYNYTFTDTLTNMTYVANSITAKVYTEYTDANHLGTEHGTLDLTDSNVILTASDSNISLAFTNLKVAKYTDGTIAAGIPADAVIVVDYNAKFTDNAVTGANGNPNSVKVTYSNNPNLDSTGTSITTTEDTPIDYAYAFTYEFDGLKVDSTTNQALTSAGFKIRDESGKYAIINSSNVVTGWTTNIAYFDSGSGVESKTTEEGQGPSMIITDIEVGHEYFFRVRSINSKGNSADWSAISSLKIGTKPSAPTTWSNTVSAVVGEDLNLYWTHNSTDGSLETFARLRMEIIDSAHPSAEPTVKIKVIENTKPE